ncbi:DUF1330 domain-containing protein [Parvularcula sp. ZS-1/3]|uniref:DUF1330 domain-containing protein n=1 Tax=Parvularcula mediterranea TaxID=2732508 RepID=A0A7Y3RP64_9PROT|nr:DUF1330 domain-containing protein [Parvularcula mediterranea]NNU17673.1 DUF1330 domain-containing protein [Parvularcula mediterranea]
MTGFIDPDREAFRQFAKMEIEGPVHMLNLIKLRASAAYADGRKAKGAEAYAAYGEASAPFFQKNGGKIVWRGTPRFPLIGPSDETWDLGFVAGYPSKDHFLAMVKDEGYQAIVFHRQAAVETSRLHCFEAAKGAGVFG